MKKFFSILSSIFVLSVFVSCSYPESYLFDLCKSGAPKEEIMASIQHDNFYDMINFKGENGFDPLFYAITYYKDIELIEFFLNNGANINVEYYKVTFDDSNYNFVFNYTTPLIWGMVTQDLNIVNCLLEYGADVNKKFRVELDNGICMDYTNTCQIAYTMTLFDIGELIEKSDSYEDSYCILCDTDNDPLVVSTDTLKKAMNTKN